MKRFNSSINGNASILINEIGGELENIRHCINGIDIYHSNISNTLVNQINKLNSIVNVIKDMAKAEYDNAEYRWFGCTKESPKPNPYIDRMFREQDIDEYGDI